MWLWPWGKPRVTSPHTILQPLTICKIGLWALSKSYCKPIGSLCSSERDTSSSRMLPGLSWGSRTGDELLALICAIQKGRPVRVWSVQSPHQLCTCLSITEGQREPTERPLRFLFAKHSKAGAWGGWGLKLPGWEAGPSISPPLWRRNSRPGGVGCEVAAWRQGC